MISTMMVSHEHILSAYSATQTYKVVLYSGGYLCSKQANHLDEPYAVTAAVWSEKDIGSEVMG